MRITRTVTSTHPIDAVYDYLADFTTTTHWDPGTERTVRVSGDGGVGTVYANTSVFNGRRTELQYVVLEADRPHRIRLRGENRTVTATDTMTFEATADGGTRVTYDADFRFRGLARLAVPFLRGAFRTLGDEAEAGLRRTLQGALHD